jgi:26S proteasome regulatory subunit N10
MVLEAVMICIDNSEWMRNSDFSPTRFEAQEDACNMISGKKTTQNVENVVGLITTAGKKGCEVHVSLTQDPGKLLQAMHKIKLGGEADVLQAVQIARLALRHRQNKRQEQRIVLFVGSPVKASEKDLVQLGGQLKKNKVAIDIVNFGEENAEENQPKLEAFFKAANNGDNCHIVTIPPGAHMLSEQLMSTPIVHGDQPYTGGGGAYVDDNIDPELAEALRLSMLQAEQDNKNREGQAKEESRATAPVNNNQFNMEEDPELAEAIRLSMLGMEEEQKERENKENTGDMVVDDEDDELAKAIRLSKETAAMDRENDEKEKTKNEMVVETKKEPAKTDEPFDMTAVDPEYMTSLLLELPGIDPNDPEVQTLLNKMKSDKDKKDEK